MSEYNEMTENTPPVSTSEADLDAPLFSADIFAQLFRRARVFIVLACILVGGVVFLDARQEIQESPEFTVAVDIQILPGDLQLDFARRTLGGTREAQIASIVRSFSEELLSDKVLSRSLDVVFGDISEAPQADAASDIKSKISAFFHWLNYGTSSNELTDPLEFYRKAIRISSVDGSFVMRVSVTLSDPERAADLANAIVAAYAEIEREKLDDTRTALMSTYSMKIDEAEAELRILIDQEVRLNDQLNIDPSNERLIGNSSLDVTAQLRTNLQRQEAIVRAIATLRSDLMQREITTSNMGSNVLVIRKAQPAQLPDGPVPLVKSIAVSASVFVLLIGSLVLTSIVKALFTRSAKN